MPFTSICRSQPPPPELVQILRNLRHENIIEMLDAFETPHEFCVVMEFAQGELFEILEDDQSLPEAQVQDIAKQLVSQSTTCFVSFSLNSGLKQSSDMPLVI